MSAQPSFTNALGLDIGMVRTGVARINAVAKIAEPLFQSAAEKPHQRLQMALKPRDVTLQYNRHNLKVLPNHALTIECMFPMNIRR